MSSNANVYTCDAVTTRRLVQDSIYGYFPSLPANAFFLALFIILLITQLYLGIKYKTWTFTFALSCGCLVEAVGYVGRLILHHNPFANSGFIMQRCCLIMGPAWLAVGIYLTLKHIVKAFGPQYTYLKPKYYTWLFIAGDCFALSLQAVGGGLSAGAIGNFNQLSLGSNIAIAGIIMQVVTLAIFASLAGLFFFRRQLARRNGVPEKEGTLVNPQLQTLRFKLFAGAVIIAFSTIFTRCVYRIAEMMGGWGNPLMQDQAEFIALDSVMCSVAAIALTVFHPGFCFPQMAQSISFGQRKILTTLEDNGPNNSTSSSSSSSSSPEVVLEKADVAKPGELYFR
ncbi:hypothetical protein HO173_006494 [Letharia columbiana]|uniref:Sphingoid long-chain base transporter RSB1 n=1 Tax=Letharia columbiana TaxID=112416 RepID=A0A8H6FUZ8_9LECA|nr:uncharacterized protein HO173_006494 [Letharia columbiana]KAF6235299.1 hypothetical protein HO173_006494 [Letharia columbiana]